MQPVGDRAQLTTAIVALVVLLAVSRFVLVTGLTLVAPEECHTGGIAREVLANGFQFPLSSYSPEHYENGIIVQGLLAVPFFKVLGPSVLALEGLAFAVGCLGALVGLLLLVRLLPSGARFGWWAGVGVYVGLLFAPPFVYLLKVTDALGDHNEGATLSLLLLLLLLRRQERPSTGRFVTLWLAAGAFVAWQKGALLVVALAAVDEGLRVVRGQQPIRRLAIAVGLAALTYSPAFVIAVGSRLGDWRDIVDKFTPTGVLAPFVTLAQLLWGYGRGSPFWLALILLGLGWLFWQARRTSTAPTSVRWVAAYAALQLLMLSLTSHDEPAFAYVHYLYPVIALGVGWAAAAGITALANRQRRLGVTATFALGGLALVLVPQHDAWRPDPGLIARLHADTSSSACSWRFGRAFSQTPQATAEGAVEACRMLGADAALSCLSGLPFGTWSPDDDELLAREERLAVAFGRGRKGTDAEDAKPCRSAYLTDDEAVEACRAGLRWECFVYANLTSMLVLGEALQAPHCSLSPSWSGYFQSTASWSPGDVWLPDVIESFNGYIEFGPACVRQMADCFPESL